MTRLRQTDTKMKLVALVVFLLLSASADLAQGVLPQNPTQTTLRPRVIVFVHGIHGSRESWRAPNGAYWPQMIKTDPRFAYSDVDVVEYPSPPSNGKSSSEQLADFLWNRLKQDHVWDHREVVFLAHSLGGILVEEMLLRHPADAAKVRFIVSYGTPHEGSVVARVASIYDKDPLLNDLSDASDNTFLTHLEDSWRGHASVNGIHRFCAYESEDTTAADGIVRYLHPHARVVSYFSATYGCDVTTPPQEIHANHVDMIRPANRSSAAYDFFRRVYRDNPVMDEQIVTRDNVIGGLEAGCDKINANPDLQVQVALDGTLHEKPVSATASLIDTVDIRDIDPNPPVVTRLDPIGVAHINYGFKGPKKLLLCVASGHASLKVEFTIDRQVPMREPQN